MIIDIDIFKVLSWAKSILDLIATVLIVTAAIFVFYYNQTVQETYLYIIAFLIVHILKLFVVYHRDYRAYNATLGLVLEYSFGVGADPDECLDKIIEWGQENNIDIQVK